MVLKASFKKPRIISSYINVLCCSIQLREAQIEPDEVKQLYLEVCSSKEKLLATLECQQKTKKDLTTLLDIETENLRKAQVDLETECQKVSVTVAVLNIPTTTNPLCGETLIDIQLINIPRFYCRFFTMYTKVHNLTLFSVNLICSLPLFPIIEIHFNIIYAFTTATWISKEKLLKRKVEWQILNHEQLTKLLTSLHSADVEELRRALDVEKEMVRALEMDLQAAGEQDSHYVATVTEQMRGLSGSVK